jgi:hypothetical protein
MPPQLHITDAAMGLWVSAFHVEYSRAQLLGGQRPSESGSASQHIFWHEARKNSARIRREIKKGDKDLSTGMLRYIPDFRTTLVGKMGRQREDSFAITNLGCFDGEAGAGIGEAFADGDLEHSSSSASSSKLRISNLLFSQSCHVNGSALQFCIVSVRGGDMNIAVSWQEGVVLVEDVDRVVAGLSRALAELGAT